MVDNTLTGNTSKIDKIVLERGMAAKALTEEELKPKANFVASCLGKDLSDKFPQYKAEIDKKLQGSELSIVIKIDMPQSKRENHTKSATAIRDTIEHLFADRTSKSNTEVELSGATQNSVKFHIVGNAGEMVKQIKRNATALHAQVATETGLKSGQAI